MHTIYETNNLPFWSEDEILERAHLSERFQSELRRAMNDRNRAWRFERIEAPMLIPRELLNPEYTDEQIFSVPSSIAASRLDCCAELAADPEMFSVLWKQASLSSPTRDEALSHILAASSDDDLASRLDTRFDPLVRLWAKLKKREPKELALRPETTPA